MALLRKKDPEWRPSENTGLKVGDTIEISDYRRLVELGIADYIDEKGNVLPLPGTVFVCGICFDKIDSHGDYINHIMEEHATENKASVIEEVEEPEKEEKEEEKNGIKIPESFGEKMRKARAVARAKREAAKEASV